jgi:murein DD-endopeptidase MepM/ murein hydrolase activator NlpD
MVKLKPFLGPVGFPNFKLKIKLGALLLCLSFLFNYQPYLAFPPIKSSFVYAEIAQESQVTPQDLGVTFQLPHEGYITSPFSSFHPGIDIATGLGMPIKPIAKGKVTSTGFNFFGLGLVVEVDHGNGYRSLYAHIGKIYTEAGKEVNENSFLGEVGLTGNTSGPHTHLEIFKDGVRIDPRLILPAIRNYPKEEDFITLSSATPSAVAIPSSASAQVKPSASLIPQPTSASQINAPKVEGILLQEKQEEPKQDLKQQSLNNSISKIHFCH